ncbi:MAG: hypothetical protein LBI42_14990 [Chitinispirillales bacterium]|jgi:hypothetical protein|nr:hypothetical protein [Chitinispirillales bacterium]
MLRKLTFIKAAAAAAVLVQGLTAAQDDAVIISAPSPWVTLRGDSLVVTVQADTSKLPKNMITFKVQKGSGGRTTTLFSKNVKMEDYNADLFLGTIKERHLGGTDFLSIEWSVPGTELAGTIEPFGTARLDPVSDSNKNLLTAVKLKDGASIGQISDVLIGAQSQSIGASKFAAGWNKEGLYILLNAADGVSEVEFAFDPKCGRNAFLSWADRFAVYLTDADSVYGVNYRRSFDKTAVTYAGMQWGEGLSVQTSESAKVIKIQWHELGLQPFEERNIGIAVFVKEKSKRTALSYPAAANRTIPVTWGSLRLEK